MKIFFIVTFCLFSYSMMAQESLQGEIKMSGDFYLDYFNKELSFEVLKSGEDKALLIKFSGEGEVKQCYYKVTRISAPQQTRGLNGVVFARMLESSPCTYKVANKEFEKFLNEIRIINIGYRIGNDLKIYGDIELLSLKKQLFSKF